MPKDDEYSELQLRALTCPQQARWPASEHLCSGNVSARPPTRRSRLSKFLEAVDEIEADCSREGKAEERKKAAEKALAAFGGLRTLARAQESVAAVMEMWEVPGGIKRASDAHEVAIRAQIREKLAGMKDMKDRMVFLERHGADPRSRTRSCQRPLFSRA